MSTRRSRTSGPGLLLRQFAAGPLPTIAVALLVLFAALLAVAVPRAIAGMHTDALAERLQARPANELDLVAESPLSPDIGPSATGTTLPEDVDAVWGGQEERLLAIRDALPEPLRAATSEPLALAVSGPVRAEVPGASPASPVYRIQPGFDPRMREHLRLVDGDWPAPLPGPLADAPEEPMDVLLAEGAATAMAWGIGEVRRTEYSGVAVDVRLSGIAAAVDPDDGFWSHAPTALRASVVDDGFAPPQYTAIAWADPASWPDFAPLALALRLEAWFPIDVEAVRADDARLLAAQLGEFSSTGVALGSGQVIEVDPPDLPPGTYLPTVVRTVGQVGFTTGTRDVLIEATTAAASVDTVLATIAAGPLGVVVAVLVLATRVVFERRRTGLELAAARGAAPGGLRSVLLVEGLALPLPAALAGGALGTAVTPGVDAASGWAIALLVALVPAAVLMSLAPALSPLRRERADLGNRRATRTRAALEGLVVALAALSVALLIGRGGAGAGVVGVDPLLAAAPLLLALAACVLVLRIYPLPLAALVARLSRRNDLVPFLGSARALRDPSAGLVPVLAVVVGMSVAVSSAVVLTSLEDGTASSSERRTGADLVVSGPPMTRDQLSAFAATEGVDAIAAVYATDPAVFEVDGRNLRVTLVVVDHDELARVQAGRFDAIDLPGSFGEERVPVPLVVSAELADDLEAGTDVAFEGDEFEVAAVADARSPFTPRPAWAMVDRDNAGPYTDSLVPRSVLVRLAPDADPPAVRAELAAAAGPDASVVDAADLADELSSGADAQGLRAGLVAAIVAATLLTALALALTLVVGQSARSRLLPLLATLGLGRRGERALVAWEIAPVTAVAVVAGVVLGAVVPVVILNGVDLRPFTGDTAAPAVAVDWMLVGGVVVASVAVSALAAAVAAGVGGRVSAARAMRKEEEG